MDYKEIYQQRYETFRHLDKLRWQMMQIGIAAGSIVLAFGTQSVGSPNWWTLLGVGMILLASGLAMMRIGSGIKANAEALSEAGIKIGDCNIPVPTSAFGGVAFWISLLMAFVGLVLALVAARQFIG